ncbi:outer membrane protein assembly factor BamE [Photobacterium toruni]|uniref:Outer membrane protein assembly factor BamE n=1 Tax=Photobacterium toruni TaxID=1935446 RepID=A0A1T4UVG1_9GAMM|nr:outer membrane protein assembly factor BamE [Photobacterium toruni]MEC6814968.1 outer membrane protein assembly factor BamE [Photobacterium toruni]SKA56626.1 Outer membrane protein assembly factor BamE precursor [Photobacterium toruni]
MSWKNIAALTLVLGLLSGCSVAERLVYRIDIDQGNYVEQKSVNTLRIGMTKTQVQYVLGTPMLVDPSYPNTWNYIFYEQNGHDKPVQKNLFLTFNQQAQLVSMKGDYKQGPNFMDPMN